MLILTYDDVCMRVIYTIRFPKYISTHSYSARYTGEAAVNNVGEIGEEGIGEGGKGEEEGGKETRHKLKSMVAFVRCKKSVPKMG